MDLGAMEQARPYQELDMTSVSWKQVGLRAGPGARNLYCHQGCCEHLLVVKDVRRLHPDDPQHLAAYPFLLERVSLYPLDLESPSIAALCPR